MMRTNRSEKPRLRGRDARPLPGWWVVAACLSALFMGLLGPDAAAQEGEAAPADSSDAPAETPKPPPPPPGGYQSGRFPMPNDAEVPLKFMPPGTNATPMPSEEIFPPQTITIRFNHKKHVKELKQDCASCHDAASSEKVSDRLMPKAAKCDSCH
ncbi:MAG TPA: cytochrome c3 family protein, partial [Polyangium sp.]|nr:cytochrome c3 family protein [Polyangium sp.]